MSLSIKGKLPADLTPHIFGLVAITATLMATHFFPTPSSSLANHAARFLSGSGNVAFLTLGYLALLISGLKNRDKKSIKSGLFVVLTVTAVIHILKFVSGAYLPRPSGSPGGFPSGHASTAFALAFLLSAKYPRFSLFWVAIASAIAWSRVPVAAHSPYQVYVGSLMGYMIALIFHEHIRPSAALRKILVTNKIILIMSVPAYSFVCRLHECENTSAIFSTAGLLFLAGMFLRIWSRLHIMDSQAKDQPFPTTGPYSIVRHPFCVADILLCAAITIGLEVIWLLPVAVIVCFIVLNSVATEEEAKLLSVERANYEQYTKQVPKWIPRLRGSKTFLPEKGSLLMALKRELPILLLIVPIFLKELLDGVKL